MDNTLESKEAREPFGSSEFPHSSPLETREASQATELRLGISFAAFSSMESHFPNHPCLPGSPPITSMRARARTHTLTLSLLKFLSFCHMVTVHISYSTLAMSDESANCQQARLTTKGEFHHKTKCSSPGDSLVNDDVGNEEEPDDVRL